MHIPVGVHGTGGQQQKQLERLAHVSAHGAARPLGHMCLEANGWKVWPTLASLAFERGCRSVCPAPPRGVQGALAAWSLNRVRHVPVVACLSQENLSYWIWKSLKQSGRPGCLLFMPILRLLSFCSARPGHGCSEWDQDEAICMEFSPGDSGDFSQGSHFPRQQALKRPPPPPPHDTIRGKKPQVFPALFSLLPLDPQS